MTASDSARSDEIADAVRRFQAEDRAAAEPLARHACRLALRTATVIVQNRDEAGDVAQDVAVDVLRSLGRLRDPAAFDAWVHRITVRHSLRLLRGRRASRAAETPLALIAETDEPAASRGTDLATLIDIRGALAAALAELPPKQRVALALRYVHDLSDEQVAVALGCRVGTAHSLLSRGRAALRCDPRLSHLDPSTVGASR